MYGIASVVVISLAAASLWGGSHTSSMPRLFPMVRLDTCPRALAEQQLVPREVRTLASRNWFAKNNLVIGITPSVSGRLLMVTQGETLHVYEFGSSQDPTERPALDSLIALHSGRLQGPFALRRGGVALLSVGTTTGALFEHAGAAPSFRDVPGFGGFRLDRHFVDSDGRVAASTQLESGQRIVLREDAGRIDTIRLPESPNRKQVVVYRDSLVTLSRPLPFFPEPQWTVGPDGEVYWSDGSSREVFRVSASGSKTVGCIAGAGPAPVSEDERAEQTEFFTWMNRVNDPKWEWNGPPVPAFQAMVEGLLVDLQGRVWAKQGAPSIPVAPAERRPFFLLYETSPLQRWNRRFAIRSVGQADTARVWFTLPERTLGDYWAIDRMTLWVIRATEDYSGAELVEFRLGG